MMVLHWGGSVLSGTVRWHGAIECWYGKLVRYRSIQWCSESFVLRDEMLVRYGVFAMCW